MTAERATFALPLPNDFQGPADLAPVLEIDELGQKRRLSCNYNWIHAHLLDIDDINNSLRKDDVDSD